MLIALERNSVPQQYIGRIVEMRGCSGKECCCCEDKCAMFEAGTVRLHEEGYHSYHGSFLDAYQAGDRLYLSYDKEGRIARMAS